MMVTGRSDDDVRCPTVSTHHTTTSHRQGWGGGDIVDKEEEYDSCWRITGEVWHWLRERGGRVRWWQQCVVLSVTRNLSLSLVNKNETLSYLHTREAFLLEYFLWRLCTKNNLPDYLNIHRDVTKKLVLNFSDLPRCHKCCFWLTFFGCEEKGTKEVLEAVDNYTSGIWISKLVRA